MPWVGRNTDQNPGMSAAEQEQNVSMIAAFFRNRGWTDNAIAALCGNMQIESYLNPGQYELNRNYNPQFGFGLVQWTPYTKYSEWAGTDCATNYNKQLMRIQYELENGLQWIPVSAYNYMTFYEFTQSTATPEYLVMAFEYSYERGTPFQAQREAAARRWFEYLGGISPTPVGNLPVWLLFKLRWNNKGR